MAAIRGDGEVLVDSLVRPMVEVKEEAREVHGIEDEDVKGAPDLPELYPLVSEILEESGLRVIVYNAAFDRGVWESTLIRHGLRKLPEQGSENDWLLTHDWECAMTFYSAYVGELYNDYDYRYQRLRGGDHSALGDARAALALVRRMAEER